MTRERRQDVLTIALILSLIVHVGLMWMMSPRVLTTVTNVRSERAKHGPMKVTEFKEKVAPLTLADVEDIAPEKEMPEASSVAMAPLSAAARSLDSEAPAEAIAAPSLEIPNLTEDNPAIDLTPPQLSVVLSADATEKSFSMPKFESVKAAMTSHKAPSYEAGNVPLLTQVKMPTAQASHLIPELDLQVAPEIPLDVQETLDSKNKFKPSDKIFEQVDEKVVADEKSAVRRILNVRSTSDLRQMANLSYFSAETPEWNYFRVHLTPKAANLPIVPKDFVVLLDASGSIGQDRIKSCRKAAREILRSCSNTGDRFNLVAFREKFAYAFNTWQTCNQQSFDVADAWLGRLAAHGRTDVFSSIRSVLTLPRQPERPLIALVVTDGDANAGVSKTSSILSNFSRLNDGLISVYMYGVKASANRELIDVLTQGNRGESFVYDGYWWKAGSGVETLATRFRDPVVTDLRIIPASDTPAEIYPRLLKNLYLGNLVEFTGRVPKSVKKVSFSLRGLHGPNAYEAYYTLDLTTGIFDRMIPADWQSSQVIDQKLGFQADK